MAVPFMFVDGNLTVVLNNKSYQVLPDHINYSIKMEPNLVQQFTQKSLSTLSPTQIEQWAGKTLDSIKIKAAEKFVRDYLTNKPIQEVLDVLDKKFGTHIGNLFASYLYYNKLSRERGKISTGGVSAVDFGRDALYGDFTPEKTGSYQQKLAYNINQATK